MVRSPTCAYAREDYFSQLDQVMALYRYLAKKDGSVLPTVHKCGDTSLSRKGVERENERQKQVLGHANQTSSQHKGNTTTHLKKGSR